MSAPTSDETSLEEGLECIRAEETVWLRIAAVLRDSEWYARIVELTSGEAPPGWTAEVWRYPRVLFGAFVGSGISVAGWLQAGRLAVDGTEVILQPLDSQVHWERRQSRAPGWLQTLEWPCAEATFSRADSQAEPHEHLISGSAAPSFVAFYAAAASFLGVGSLTSGGNLPRGTIYRHQDLRGRIARVRVANGAATAVVEGGGIAGMLVELAGDAPGVSAIVPEGDGPEEAITFPLENGLPAGAWILLKQGSEWVDLRFLTRPWMSTRDVGVEFLEPATRLEVLLEGREGPDLEFKEIVPDNDEARWKVMKTVCGFANGGGGSILFGVSDDGDVPGLPVRGIDAVKDRLTDLVGSWVQPRPSISFDVLPLENEQRAVLEMKVGQGVTVYGSRGRRETEVAYYVRHYATTVRARPNEIEAIVRARTPSGQPWRGPYSL